MPIPKDVFLEAHPSNGASIFTRLKPHIYKLIHLPVLSHLRPFARQVMAVAEPVGKLTVQPEPSTQRLSGNRPITIISANLWHDWPKHRNFTDRLESFAGMVQDEEADVVLLQEVSRRNNFHVDRWLSERLGMAYAYSRANGHEAGIGFEEGLAVLSRFPIQRLYLQQLGSSTNIFVHRLAMGAKVLSPWGAFAAISVHLGLIKNHNTRQMVHLHSWINSVLGGLPAIIGGDFNAHESSVRISRLRTSWLDTFRFMHPDSDGTTHELCTPQGKVLRRSRLDYIFLRHGRSKWKVLETRHLDGRDGPHSDHRAVLTRLVLNT